MFISQWRTIFQVWDLNRLRVWRAVVKAGSVNAAARNLQYAPASVSQHIIALERTVGYPIYRRSGRGIEITDAGRQLADESEPLFVEAKRLEALTEAVRTGPRPRLTIGCFSSVAKEWIPTVLGEVVRRYPDLRFDIMTNEPLIGTERRFGDLDIANEPGHAEPQEVSGYRREELIDDEYMVVLPRGHRLSAQRNVAVGELAEEPMVDLSVIGGPTQEVVEHVTQAAGFSPKYVARADDHYGILAMVSAGIGVTVLPRLAIGELPADLTARPLVDPTPIRRVVLLVRREIAHLEHIEFIRTSLRSHAGHHRGYSV
ncbi:LysR family transcriptional regulator [Brevibacterium sp. 'Marine']|uniref:LysR family transcriptional regulator n=1 Tax=Brevibacterium sp. 'Marine' TaxID=2725563 RepID=UPI00145E3770|nr:LysR family transcriptional regulator [Brevibacterium sp. 'Marine']